MEHSVEWFVLVTSVVIALSHVFYPSEWGAAFEAMHRAGRPGRSPTAA